MRKSLIIPVLMLAGFAMGASAQAVSTDPCVSTPDASATSGQSAVPGGLADPGPCKISTSPKNSKNSKSSNNSKGSSNGKGAGNGNGSGNGNGNGNGSDNGQGDGSDESKIQQGLAIAPVSLNLQGRNRALVALGSYIVNAQAGCNDCHTWPNYAQGGDPFKGQTKMVNVGHYLAGGRPFGTIVSRNLTPPLNPTQTEAQRLAEFMDVMRYGHDPDQQTRLLQVMPWPVYQDMTDRDLQAIFEYLQAIPHAEPCGASDPDPNCKL